MTMKKQKSNARVYYFDIFSFYLISSPVLHTFIHSYTLLQLFYIGLLPIYTRFSYLYSILHPIYSFLHPFYSFLHHSTLLLLPSTPFYTRSTPVLHLFYTQSAPVYTRSTLDLQPLQNLCTFILPFIYPSLILKPFRSPNHFTTTPILDYYSF